MDSGRQLNFNQSSKSNDLMGKYFDEVSQLNLTEQLKPVFLEIVNEEKLDNDIVNQFETIYLPLSDWVATKHTNKPIVIGVNGAQGTGKSTLCKIIQSLLINGYGKNVIQISIDDLYLSKEMRSVLSKTVHPLLKTRGVPGTHDVNMGIEILEALVTSNLEDGILLPIFDKSIDDLLPRTKWPILSDSVDIILFEGWCVGSIAQGEEELLNDINQLERIDDSDKIWRNYVNQQLSGPYQDLFKYIDYTIMLEVPDMESVYKWRSLQEKKLKDVCEKSGNSTDKLMADDQIRRFIMHYERITQFTLNEMPKRADVVLRLDKNHQIYDVRMKE